jgi:hypothetical protein
VLPLYTEALIEAGTPELGSLVSASAPAESGGGRPSSSGRASVFKRCTEAQGLTFSDSCLAVNLALKHAFNQLALWSGHISLAKTDLVRADHSGNERTRHLRPRAGY